MVTMSKDEASADAAALSSSSVGDASSSGGHTQLGISVVEAEEAMAMGARWGLEYRNKAPNAMTGVDSFLNLWMNPKRIRQRATLHVSSEGNINRVGMSGEHAADDLDPLHPSWTAAIEPRILPLVNVLAQEFGVVTYDSCEGHRSRNRPAARVGVLPRTHSEGDLLARAALRAVSNRISETPWTWAAFVSTLKCSDTGRRFVSIELRLDSSTFADRTTFFRLRGRAVELFASEMRRSLANIGDLESVKRPAGRRIRRA